MTSVIVGTIAIVAITVVIGIFVEKKLRAAPQPDAVDERARARRATSHAPGEAPATAIRATDERLANLRASQRCPACRAPARDESVERVRYGGRELLVLRFRCTRCDEPRRLYVEPA